MPSLPNIRLELNERLYLKDPESTELGKRIIRGSIELLSQIGFDAFTFRKLSLHIGSPEASVYRYFGNKHVLLNYLTNWYWSWMEYRLVFSTQNLPTPEKKLRRAIQLVTENTQADGQFHHIDERLLYQIVVSESPKTFLTKAVDQENESGFFLVFKRVVHRIAEWIKDLNPDYQAPHSLVVTVIEGAHMQKFFADHLPSLCDIPEGAEGITRFYQNLIFQSIRHT